MPTDQPPAPALAPDRPSPSNRRTRRRQRSDHLTRRTRSERGQATAEYALVMLAAAAIAGLLLAWAASTGGIGRLLDSVMDTLIGQTEPDE